MEIKNLLKIYVVLAFLSGFTTFPAVAGDASGEEKEPASVESCYEKGRECLNRGEYESANEWFKKAEELISVDDAPAALPLSEVEQKVLAEEIESRNILEQAARAAEKNQLDKSLEYYFYALESFPRQHDIYYNIAVLYLKKQEYHQAAEWFKKMTKVRPKDADAWYNLGVIYENHLDDKKQALAYYRKYLILTPDAADAPQVKGWVKFIEQEVVD